MGFSKKKLFLVFIFLMLALTFFLTAAVSATATVTIRAYDRNSNVITNALIVVYDSNWKYLTKEITDSFGRVYFNLPTWQSYYFELFVKGFCVGSIEKTISENISASIRTQDYPAKLDISICDANGNILPNAKVKLYDKFGSLVATSFSDSFGNVSFIVPAMAWYNGNHEYVSYEAEVYRNNNFFGSKDNIQITSTTYNGYTNIITNYQPKVLISYYYRYFDKDAAVIVVGKKAAQLDYDCARKIQTLFKNASIITDKEALATNITRKYRVIFTVGGPQANNFTLQLQPKMPKPFSEYGFGWALSGTRKQDQAVIETFFDDPASPTQIYFIIAGNTREGTLRATNELLKQPEIEGNVLMFD
ncbi:MAG: hypothetical protein HY929_08945 [Euryarchaeota archaeon]|nr:hypothetical protein [Euryarchaeota archaeon]